MQNRIVQSNFNPRPFLARIRGPLLVAVLLATALGAHADSSERIAPPVAKAVPHEMTEHGHTRVDNYYWMRDDSRTDPEILSYLKAENEYHEKVLAHTGPMRKKLYDEMTARIDPAERTVPVRLGKDWYYERYDAGKDYRIIVRRAGSAFGPEEVALDGNERAGQHTIEACIISEVLNVIPDRLRRMPGERPESSGFDKISLDS